MWAKPSHFEPAKHYSIAARMHSFLEGKMKGARTQPGAYLDLPLVVDLSDKKSNSLVSDVGDIGRLHFLN